MMSHKASLIILMMLFMTSLARSFDVISLKEFSIDYKRFVPNGRNAVLYPDQPKEGINLGINMDLFKYAYWDSQVLSLTTDAQYRMIGLNTRLGLRPLSWVEVGYFHESLHLLDRPIATMPKFPVQDALELKLFIYRSKEGRESIVK